MKNSKKFAAMIAALTLSACSIAPMFSFAATNDTTTADATETEAPKDDETPEGANEDAENNEDVTPAPTLSATNKITIEDTDGAKHNYEAYQIFAGTYNAETQNLDDVEWGSGVEGAKILSALQADATLQEYFADCDTAEKVALALGNGEVFGNDAELTQAFIKIVGNNLSDTKAGTSKDGVISGLSDGYYLVQDAEKPTDGIENEGARTRFIAQAVGGGSDIKAVAKHSAPSVMKKVKENSVVLGNVAEIGSFKEKDASWNDIADYNIGDAVPFKLYGTMPSTLADYEHYYYKFTDNLGKEFTIADNAKFKISVNGEEIITLTLEEGKAVDSTLGTDILIDATKNDDISITFKDVKALVKDISDVITVEYEATLNNAAVIGLDGQVNGVTLTYSNNPNLEYKPKEDEKPKEEGKTKWDGVIVFTYGIDIDKVDGESKKLADAKFALYTMDGTTKTYLSVNADGEVTPLKSAPTTETEVSPANGVWISTGLDDIEIKGLDAGDYYIQEIAAPTGYNKLDKDIKFTVAPTMAEQRQEWIYNADKSTAKDALKELNIAYGSPDATLTGNNASATAETGKGTIQIVNHAGTALPSTGGVGATVFYLGGGAMVAVAGVYLITKKRMGKSEN